MRRAQWTCFFGVGEKEKSPSAYSCRVTALYLSTCPYDEDLLGSFRLVQTAGKIKQDGSVALVVIRGILRQDECPMCYFGSCCRTLYYGMDARFRSSWFLHHARAWIRDLRLDRLMYPWIREPRFPRYVLHALTPPLAPPVLPRTRPLEFPRRGPRVTTALGIPLKAPARPESLGSALDAFILPPPSFLGGSPHPPPAINEFSARPPYLA